MKERFPAKPTTDTLDDEITYCQKLVEVIEKEAHLCEYPKKIKEPLNLLKETIADDIEQLRSMRDQDARVGHKSADSSFLGYKTHLAICKERIITVAHITTGEKPDGKQLPTLVEKSKVAGIEVEEAIGDMAYSEKDNISYCQEEDIKLISKLNPVVTQGIRKKKMNLSSIRMPVCLCVRLGIRQSERNVMERRETERTRPLGITLM
ncbi:hypothetical protein GCM10020331_001410 [Ectobacillus funiculus]